MSERRFTGTLEEANDAPGRWIEVPFDARRAFGQARPPVRGTVNGTPIRTRLAVYGGRTYLGITRAVRDAAGLKAGDHVKVVLELDDEPRVVSPPPELAGALTADAQASAAFEALSFTHRREYADWVGEAKREETRRRRAARAVEMLRAGVPHP